jgi:hypothetical protein
VEEEFRMLVAKDLFFSGKTSQWQWVHQVSIRRNCWDTRLEHETFIYKNGIPFLVISKPLHKYLTPLQCYILLDLAVRFNKHRYYDLTHIYAILVQTMHNFDSYTVEYLTSKKYPKITLSTRVTESDIWGGEIAELTTAKERATLPYQRYYNKWGRHDGNFEEVRYCESDAKGILLGRLIGLTHPDAREMKMNKGFYDVGNSPEDILMEVVKQNLHFSCELRVEYDKALSDQRAVYPVEYLKTKADECALYAFLEDIGMHDHLNPYIHKASAICAFHKHTPPSMRPPNPEWQILARDEGGEDGPPLFLLHVDKKSEQFPMMLYYLEGPLVDNLKSTRFHLGLIGQQVYWEDARYSLGPVDF